VASARVRGKGVGGELMRRVDAFLEASGHRRSYLTTFAGLDAARALYGRHGYVLVAEEKADPWSGTVGLQRFERRR
jgi:GNAT superfamily N-acetyltransferase